MKTIVQQESVTGELIMTMVFESAETPYKIWAEPERYDLILALTLSHLTLTLTLPLTPTFIHVTLTLILIHDDDRNTIKMILKKWF
jgi:hypothetical protein